MVRQRPSTAAFVSTVGGGSTGAASATDERARAVSASLSFANKGGDGKRASAKKKKMTKKHFKKKSATKETPTKGQANSVECSDPAMSAQPTSQVPKSIATED
jgi:hypothetical protein